MSRLLICRLPPKRLAAFRKHPAQLARLRAAIRGGTAAGALDMGRMEDARVRRLEARLGSRAWKALQQALDSNTTQELRQGVVLLAPADVMRLAKAMKDAPRSAAPSRSLEALADALRLLLLRASASGEQVLVFRTSAAVRLAARQRLSAQEQRRAEGALERRQEWTRHRDASELDVLVLRIGLHTSGKGLRHPDPPERESVFHDLCDRFFDVATGAPRKLVAGEIRELVLLWASGGAHHDSRRLAAMALERIARSTELGGPFADDTRAALQANLGELSEFIAEIASETDARARAAIAVACSYVGLAPFSR